MATARNPRERPWRGMPPAERDAQRRRRLLDAALERFGTDGLAATSVAALCAEANVATRSLYELFGSREDLLLALFDELMTELTENIAKAWDAGGDDMPRRIRGGVTAVVDTLLADERKGRIVELEVVGVSPALERRRRRAVRDMAELLDGEVVRARDAGLLPADPTPAMLVFVINGGVTGALIDWLETPRSRRASRTRLIAELTDVWLHVLRVT